MRQQPAPVVGCACTFVLIVLFAASASTVQAQEPDCRPEESARQCYRRALAFVDTIEVARARKDTAAETRGRASLHRGLEAACSRGRSAACYLHARMLFIEQSNDSAAVAKAATLFQTECQAEPRNAAACHGLGDAYELGLGRRLAPDSAFHYTALGCDLGNPRACARASVALRDFQGLETRERIRRGIELSAAACRAGSMNGCVSLVFFQYQQVRQERSLPDEAVTAEAQPLLRDSLHELLEPACSLGIAIGCSNLGWLYETKYRDGDQRAGARAAYYYRIACEGVLPPAQHLQQRANAHRRSAHGHGCMSLGSMFKAGRYLAQHDDSARVYTERACHELLYSDACVRLVRRDTASEALPPPAPVGDGAPAIRVPVMASLADDGNLRLLMTGCYERNGSACNSAGVMFLTVIKDTAQAEAHYRRGCDLGDPYSCSNLGALNSRRQTDETRRVSYKYNRRSCELDGVYGCYNLGLLLRDDGYDEMAARYFERSCQAGYHDDIGMGCWEAARWHAQQGNAEKSARYRAHACRAEATYCKKKT